MVGSRKRKKPEEGGEDGDAGDSFYTVQTSWGTFCKSEHLKKIVETAVPCFTEVCCSAWILLNFHLVRLIDEGGSLDCFTQQTLFYDALRMSFLGFDTFLNGGTKVSDKHPELNVSFNTLKVFGGMFYDGNRPKGEPYVRILNAKAKEMLTNMGNHVGVHFQTRHEHFLRWKVREMDVPYFENGSKLESAVRFARTLSMFRPHDDICASFEDYPCLKDIPDDARAALYLLVDNLRDLVDWHTRDAGLDTFEGKLRWMRYILLQMERELDDRSQSPDSDWAGGKSRLRLFSMTPHGDYQATYVHLDRTLFTSVVKRGGNDCRLVPAEHVCFAMEKTITASRERRGYVLMSVKTDGVSVSVTIKKPKSGIKKAHTLRQSK